MKHAATKVELERFLQSIIEQSEFKLEQIPITSQDKWAYDSHSLSHSSGGFFHILGLVNRKSGEEEIVLYQPQSALTGIALHNDKRQVRMLIQARPEPGNTGIAQFGPTIQSTAANYTRQHGGRKTNYLDKFYSYEPGTQLISYSYQTDLGKLYYQKIKTHNYIVLPELVDPAPGVTWVDLTTLLDVVQKDYFLNTDFRSLLAVFDWDCFALGKRNPATIKTDLLDRLWQKKFSAQSPWTFRALTELKSWSANDNGIMPTGTNLRSVAMYTIHAKTREVTTWNQPLLDVQGSGLVRLFRRRGKDGPEYLLSVINEFGIDGGYILGPSVLHYPGDTYNYNDAVNTGETFRSFWHSEEGGRFINHESLFEIVNISNIEPKENQVWVPTVQLKKILQTSNLVCIQLRVICSALLDELNPGIFGSTD